MIPIPAYLENHEAVLRAFGYWPSFHDGEIITLVMDRSRILFDRVHNARIEIVIHGWEMTNEVTDQGFFKLQKHHLIHFEFEDVRDVSLTGFNHQNAVLSLSFEELLLDVVGNHCFKVTFDPAHGIGGDFTSFRGRVLSVIPCDSEGNAAEQGAAANP